MTRRETLALTVAAVGTMGLGRSSQTPLAQTTPPAPLPPILGPLEPNNWSNAWTPGDWPKSGGVYPWNARNVRLLDGTLAMSVTRGSAASVQANSSELRSSGTFEIDATLPQGRPGLIIAPLYLYGADGHEIDFEVVGTHGLQLAIHTRDSFNAFVKLFPGNFSGRRTFKIGYDAERLVSWSLDGVELARLSASETTGAFPTHPLKPYAEIWPTLNTEWAGRWNHHDVEMQLHGYRVS